MLYISLSNVEICHLNTRQESAIKWKRFGYLLSCCMFIPNTKSNIKKKKLGWGEQGKGLVYLWNIPIMV